MDVNVTDGLSSYSTGALFKVESFCKIEFRLGSATYELMSAAPSTQKNEGEES